MLQKAQDDDLVMSLVEMALARLPGEREDYLRSACDGDSDLFTEVWTYVECEERMNGFLLEPLYPSDILEHPFEPGDLLVGRFRILCEIAQGGMGIVYEAVDEKLDRRIALKCAKTGYRKRLPPEVRHASDISHTNVCKIFEIHTASTEHGEIDFLTMEFLDGDTLADRFRDGPLPKEEVLTIARQLCAGLAAAHRCEVVHGDLKSGNVILTTSADGAMRAVITDFGLAHTSRASQRTQQSGPACGTPNYMAPELWDGEKATVASDIYALGMILSELAGGEQTRRPSSLSPSTRETTRTMAPWERFRGRRPAWQSAAPHSRWHRIVQRCLDPDPAKRFRDADELARALAPSRVVRWVVGMAAAAVLAAASGLATYHAASGPQESVRLVVLPFASGQDTAPLAEALSRDTADQLARLKGNSRTSLTVIPLATSLRKKVNTAEEARKVLGATHVLHVRLVKENDRLMLQVHLTEAQSLANSKEWKAAYAFKEARHIPVALAGVVTWTLRLPLLQAVATVNSAAHQEHLAGLTYLRRDTGVPAALASFERAVAADPDSALAYAGLAEAQWFTYFLTKDRTWLNRSEESARQAERRNPDLAPVHRISGMHRAEYGAYELAAAEYRRAIELEPGNAENYRRLGQVYERNNQLHEALIELKKSIDVQPDYYRVHLELGAFYYRRADYDQAIKHLNMAVSLAPEDPNVHRAVASAYINVGRFPDAERELRLANNLQETPASLIALGVALTYQGRDPEAVPYLLRALNLDPQRFFAWMNLADVYRRMGHLAESERANRRGSQLAELEIARDPRKGHVRSVLAYLNARLGDRRRAESEIAQALSTSPNDVNTLFMAALTYETLEQREKTLEILRASPPGVIADLSRWPDVADLHKDSRFKQLLDSTK